MFLLSVANAVSLYDILSTIVVPVTGYLCQQFTFRQQQYLVMINAGLMTSVFGYLANTKSTQWVPWMLAIQGSCYALGPSVCLATLPSPTLYS